MTQTQNNTSAPTTLAQVHCFGGTQGRYQHHSDVNHCDMTFSVFVPPHQNAEQRFPVLYWLSGLTCTDENFVQKAGAQRIAAELGMIIVAPDTSPRGDSVPDEAEAWDFGKGAGFYVDASEKPWSEHYNMYSYITKELPAIIDTHFPSNGKAAISGHSMGGHGALICGLKNPERYTSISAFAPISNPTQCPWGQKAFSHYLGENQEDWKHYDACELLQTKGLSQALRIDQGLADSFLVEQLKPEAIQRCLEEQKLSHLAEVHLHEHYDHSYFFISSFIEAHLRFHYAALAA